MPRRREEIVQTAARIFAERGFVGTSIRDIASACELLPASLYSHFESKTQILDDVLTPFFDELLPRLTDAAHVPGTGLHRLAALLEEALACCSENLFAYRIAFHDWNLISRQPELDHLVQRTAETSALWLEVATAGIEDGSVRRDIAPNLLVRILQPMMYGVLDDRYDLLFPAGRQPSAHAITPVVLSILLAGIAGDGLAQGERGAMQSHGSSPPRLP
jgi:TetR/AcrR family transcriptional regulator, cholesterol catabolism regulator